MARNIDKSTDTSCATSSKGFVHCESALVHDVGTDSDWAFSVFSRGLTLKEIAAEHWAWWSNEVPYNTLCAAHIDTYKAWRFYTNILLGRCRNSGFVCGKRIAPASKANQQQDADQITTPDVAHTDKIQTSAFVTWAPTRKECQHVVSVESTIVTEMKDGSPQTNIHFSTAVVRTNWDGGLSQSETVLLTRERPRHNGITLFDYSPRLVITNRATKAELRERVHEMFSTLVIEVGKKYNHCVPKSTAVALVGADLANSLCLCV